MVKELIKLSNHLDSNGLVSEANFLDNVIAQVMGIAEHPQKTYNEDGSVCLSCKDKSWELSDNDYMCRKIQQLSEPEPKTSTTESSDPKPSGWAPDEKY